MILKWTVLNIGITTLIIIFVGLSMKEFACYQFNQFAQTELQSHQFRKLVGDYLIQAGLLTFLAAVLIHLLFAKKILHPLYRLSHLSRNLNQQSDADPVRVSSKDEVGRIANDLNQVSNRLKNLDQQNNQMMGSLAHELRTPLTTLNGYLEGLESGVFDEDPSIYTLLKNECVHLMKLMENMHEYHQWENGHITLHKQRIDMKETIQSGVARFQKQFAESGIDIETHLDFAHIDCDPRAIQTVLSHLLDNVIRFDVGKQVMIVGKFYNNEYVISLSNRGMPIPKVAEKQLFDPFFRVEHSRNRETGGSGLGLAIVKEIVNELNGKTGFYTEHHFHTFWFSIRKG